MKRFLERLRIRGSIGEELDAHLEEKASALMESGLSETEARLRSRREFGNATLIAEDSRSALGWTWFDNLVMDLRYALRMLRRSPAFTAIAVLSLALGIGANTAIFSLLDALVLKTLPVTNPQELWAIGLADTSGKPSTAQSYPLYVLWRDHNRSIGSLAAAGSFTWRDTSPGSNRSVHEGQFVSGNYFDVLGVPALIGRSISPADDSIEGAGGPQGAVAMLSYRYWSSAFHRDPSVPGRSINVNGVWLTVVGVTPPEFFGIQVGSSPDVFVPMQLQPPVSAPENLLHNVKSSETTWVTVMGRIGPGLSHAQIKSDLTPIYAEYALTRLNPADQRAFRSGKKPLSQCVILEPAARGFSRLRESFSEPLRVLMALVVIVLLIACANVANLLLARANARRGEIAIRLAIGAGRFRILRQLLAESLVLSLAGGALGLLFALWSGRLLVGMLPQGQVPLLLDIGPDHRVLGFTLAVSMLTGLLFGLAPAWRATQPAANGGLSHQRIHGERASRLEPGKVVVVVELALAVQLLVGAGLFITTLHNLTTADAGFQRRNVMQVRINLDAGGYPRTQWGPVYEQVAERIAALPGVTFASLANRGLIENGVTRSGPVHYPSYTFRPGENRNLAETYIGPDYFKAAGIPLRMGRSFTGRDGTSSAQVAIVNEEAVRRYFAGRNPIGQRYGFGDSPDQIEIVGVVSDAKYNDLRQEFIPMAYYPWRQVMPARLGAVVVRTSGDPAVLAPALRRAVMSVHPDIFVDARTLASQIEGSLVRERLLAHLSGFLGALAMLLACIGIYGVMAYGVTRRTSEIGVRMALGATPGSVIRMVLRESLLLAVCGIAVGVPVALWLSRLTGSFLFGLKPNDPAVVVAAGSSLLIVCALAGWPPAWRAARIAPTTALRSE
jgi:predicted permease